MIIIQVYTHYLICHGIARFDSHQAVTTGSPNLPQTQPIIING